MKFHSPIRLYRNRRMWGMRAEALLELAFSKLRITLLPMRYWTWPRGRFQSESLREDRAADLPRILSIRRSVEWSARWVPWRSKCLDQALAAQRMLARRGLGSTLYYGMARSPEKKWLAHAWVRCGDQWAIGHQTEIRYALVGTCALVP
jgi:hypothetical protein